MTTTEMTIEMRITKLMVYGRIKGRCVEIIYDKYQDDRKDYEASVDRFSFSSLPYWY